MTITAASVPVKLKDGTEYRFSPLTDKDIDEMENWVKSRIIQIARDSFDENITAEERQELLSIALRQASEVSILSPRSAAMIASVPGMIKLCWYSLRKEHPNITDEDLRKHMMDPENIDIINEVFERVNDNPFIKNGQEVKNSRRARKVKKVQRQAKKRNRKINR